MRLGGLREAFSFLVQCRQRVLLVELQIRGISTPLFARRLHTDLDVLWGVFGKRECDVAMSKPPQFIVDGGANVGFTSVFFANQYPDAQIVAIEPDANNCDLIRRNCGGIPNVRVIQAGLWTSNAALTIKNPNDPSWAFQLGESPQAASGSVNGITIPNLLAQSVTGMIDILKLDIEGAEERLFSDGYTDWIDKVRTIIIEIHNPACEQAVLQATNGRCFAISKQQEKFVFTRTP